MKHIYMNVSITRYSHKGLDPDCDLYQKIDDEEMTHTKLDYNTACRMIWELVLAGYERKVEINQFNPSISTVRATLWVSY